MREMREFLADNARLLRAFQQALNITAAEQKHPTKIPNWKGPFKLSETKTKSQPFLKWMIDWFYDDTSAEAHLIGTGLFRLAPFLMPGMADPQTQKLIEQHQLQQYRTRHLSRTFALTIALLTEIDDQCKLNNPVQISYVWGILSNSKLPDIKEMFYERYNAMLAVHR